MSLFEKYGYAVRSNAPGASRQNYLDVGPHRNTLEAVGCLMVGHPVPLKLWQYSPIHYIKVNGMVPHGESDLSPDEQLSGKDLMLGISIVLVDGFISDLQVERVTRWTITSKRCFLLDIQPPSLRYLLGYGN